VAEKAESFVIAAAHHVRFAGGDGKSNARPLGRSPVTTAKQGAGVSASHRRRRQSKNAGLSAGAS